MKEKNLLLNIIKENKFSRVSYLTLLFCLYLNGERYGKQNNGS